MNVSDAIKTGSVAPVAPTLKVVTGSSKPAQGVPSPDARPLPAQSDMPRNTASRINSAELHSLVDKANEALPVNSSNLKFSVAEGTNINVVRIEDTETGELIRQIPSETMVALARALAEDQHGMMLEEKA